MSLRPRLKRTPGIVEVQEKPQRRFTMHKWELKPIPDPGIDVGVYHYMY